jgi:hypothetical protein
MWLSISSVTHYNRLLPGKRVNICLPSTESFRLSHNCYLHAELSVRKYVCSLFTPSDQKNRLTNRRLSSSLVHSVSNYVKRVTLLTTTQKTMKCGWVQTIHVTMLRCE